MTDTARGRRSDATRAAILSAARERFAAGGYERATIRAIAADAGIDPAMVMRYYGSKERLFAAAAEFDLRLPDLSGVPVETVGQVLVRHMLERWESDETLTALLRAGATNEAAAERMREIFSAQVGPVLAPLCPDPAQVPVRIALVSSQVLGLALARYVLRLAPIAQLSHDEVVAWLAPTIQRYLLDR
ncbi:TetR family transcriptional regulator [Rugosimonospora acidiphila]|uniref:TetR family transcriptional regulator n=1 Tax=Rugosimonospora acidiphila TaxID=556531 RepID=A0ABP9RXC5_9ACTN